MTSQPGVQVLRESPITEPVTYFGKGMENNCEFGKRPSLRKFVKQCADDGLPHRAGQLSIVPGRLDCSYGHAEMGLHIGLSASKTKLFTGKPDAAFAAASAAQLVQGAHRGRTKL